jgi:tryptophanyl-tRNA synthetase
VVKEAKTAVASFKQYREKDGQFYFKLVSAQGQLLLQSRGFASPKEAGQTIARLQTEGMSCWTELSSLLEPLASEANQHVAQALSEIINSQKAAG